jgi:glycosyltransferase involved in cell wall biosynthesis
MRVGVVIEETWAFFTEINAELEAHHETRRFGRRTVKSPLFNARLNRYLYEKDRREFYTSNQVVFFEWASEALANASRELPKTCGVAARLHRYEMYRWADRINWDWVDRLIVVSEAKRKEFAERFPAHGHKAVVIPEAISLDRFEFQPRPFSGEIGILCHLTPRKRVYELILAFHELVRRQPGFRLHIGGGEHVMFRDYYRALHTLVRDLGLQERVIFYGPVQDPPAWYRQLDIFISNSYSEGLQVSPMEAIASGRYCLSHRWEGADELLPADSLYWTENELVDAILGYAGLSEAGRQEQITRQRARVKECFDIERIKVQVREVVEAAGADWERRRSA